MPLLLFSKKRQDLKLSSAANYRWRFMGLTLDNFHVYFLSIQTFFFKITLLEELFQEHYQSIKQFVSPDLGPNSLQRLSAYGKSALVNNKSKLYSMLSNINIGIIIEFSKTCVKQPFSKRPKIVFKTNYHSMRVKSIAECSNRSILKHF